MWHSGENDSVVEEPANQTLQALGMLQSQLWQVRLTCYAYKQGGETLVHFGCKGYGIGLWKLYANTI